MNKRAPILRLVLLAALLLPASLQGMAAPEAVAMAQPLPGKEPAAGYAMQPGTAIGGAYQLTIDSASERLRGAEGSGWSVRGAAGGGNYRLDPVIPVRGTGTPCCCSYLPCATRGYR